MRALKYYIPLGDISIVAWPSSLKREAHGMGEETGVSFGMGTRFRHEGGVEELLLPDGITSTGSTQKEVTLALCHYNIGTLHGSQLSCIGGMSRRRWLETWRNKHEHRCMLNKMTKSPNLLARTKTQQQITRLSRYSLGWKHCCLL